MDEQSGQFESKLKKLRRSKKDKMLAGVCGGLGEYFGVDPIIFRILFFLLVAGGGVGVLLYIFLAIVVPEEGRDEQENLGDRARGFASEVKSGMQQSGLWQDRRNLVGYLIILLGLFFLFNQLFPHSWVRWDFVWPVLIIVIGFWILIRRRK